MIYERVVLAREILSPRGSIYVHVGQNISHRVRSLMDEVFGPEHFLNEIVWQRTGAHNDAGRFGNIVDVMLFYSKGEKWIWNQQYAAYDDAYVEERYHYTDDSGRRFWPNQITGPGPGPARLFKGQSLAPPRGRHWAYTQEDIDRLDREERIYYSQSGLPYLKNYLDEQPGRPVQNLWTDMPMSASIDRRLVERLRPRGFDVLTAREAGKGSEPDDAQPAYATGVDRVLLSYNRRDFRRLHQDWSSAGRGHGGIVLVPQTPPLSRRVLRISMLLDWVGSPGAGRRDSRLLQWNDLQRVLHAGGSIPGYTADELRDVLGET